MRHTVQCRVQPRILSSRPAELPACTPLVPSRPLCIAGTRLTSLNGNPSVVHVTPDVCEDLGPLETHLADGLAVGTRFGRGGRGGELDVFDSEVVKAGLSAVWLGGR